MIKKITVDELPEYTPWVKRLLHLETFSKPIRDLTKIDAEYDKDKYLKLLSYYNEHPGASIAEIRLQETLRDSYTVCFSRKGELFLTSIANLHRLQEESLIDTLSEPLSKARVVVELGCGYGYNFSFLRNAFHNRLWLGGEYSKNAIELANRLFANYKDVSVANFNWYDDTWAILEGLKGKALLFTRHSLEQLPKAKAAILTLRKYRDKIAGIVNLEPIYELIDTNSTLGLMRQAYTLMNDYNTDLLSVLKSMRVQILRKEVDIIGTNPLNPTSLVYWNF